MLFLPLSPKEIPAEIFKMNSSIIIFELMTEQMNF